MNNLTILAIDDNRDNLTTVRAVVSDRLPGAKILTAQDGREGIELALAEDPDVILLDIVMPGMDGYVVCRKIKGNDMLADIPVIFLTALRTGLEGRIKALEVGAEGFLTKPFDEIELIAQIRAMAKIKQGNRRERQEKAQLTTLVAERTLELEQELAERKLAEQALLESEARYRRITEGLADYQYTVRVENGRALETVHSPACNVVTGYSAEEFAANPYLWFDMVAPEDSQLVTERIKQVLSGKDIPPLEHKIIRKDGDGAIRWVSVNIICHRDASGALQSYDGVVKDITGRKQSEAANQMLMQETQDRYHEISSLMRASRAVLENRDFKSSVRLIFEECKQQLGATAGYVALLSADGSQNEVLLMESDGGTCILPGVLSLPMQGLHAEAYRTGKAVFDNDFKNSAWMQYLPKGHMEFDNVIFAPIPVHGKGVGLIGLANKPGGFNEEDARIATGFGEIAALALTNSRNLESLENSEIRFRSLVETATDAIVSIDTQGCITHWNPGAENIFGYTASETMGKNITIIVPPNAQEAHSSAFARTLACGQLQHVGTSREVFGLKKDGTELPIELTLSRWQTGEGVFFTSIIRDITERKQQEETRSRLQAQLNQAQKMEAIGVLAGGIAHDFNNILGAIMGYAEMARDDSPDGSQVAGDLDKVLTAANRAKELVKQILGFSRQSTTDRIPIQIQPLISESLKMLRASIPTTINISENIDPRCGVVLAEPTQVHQITMNLCSNAFHSMEETGGKLTVALNTVLIDPLEKLGSVKPGEYVELTVSDTGRGIGPDIIENIFDPYFTTKEVGKGTGMGLSITHGIITSYGGTITVESILGRGTTFRVYFPVIQEEPKKPESIEKALPGKERILFLDDEEVLTQMGKVMLERLGYTVTAYTKSIEALAHFIRDPQKFDLVITDQTMPTMTGIDLARRMLQIRPDLPIIICTGYSNLVSEESAKIMGIKAFVLKPLTRDAIGRLAREVLHKAELDKKTVG